jgi:MYXO-CTERM domain-containing protein
MAIGVFGLAAGVSDAGSVGIEAVVELTFDRTSIGIGETARATITASWNGIPPGAYFSSITVDLIASGDFGLVSEIVPVAWNNPAMGFNGQGVASGADVIGLQAAQFSLIPPYTTDNPILITTFTVTGTAAGELSYHSDASAGAPYSYSIVTSGFNCCLYELTDEIFISQTLVVTPGPGVVGVLGVAGLVGVRRRRG